MQAGTAWAPVCFPPYWAETGWRPAWPRLLVLLLFAEAEQALLLGLGLGGLLCRLLLGGALLRLGLLLGGAHLLGGVAEHLIGVLLTQLAAFAHVDVQSGDDEHVSQTQSDVHDGRRHAEAVAGEAGYGQDDGQDQAHPPDFAQALVFRGGRVVELAVALGVFGALLLALGLLLLGRLLR